MISSRPEGLPKSPKPRLFKAESASNIRPRIDPTIHVLEEKKTLYTGVRRAHSSCAPNNIYCKTRCKTLYIVILVQPGPRFCFYHGTTASSNIEKVWIGSKTFELWSRGRVRGAREKPEVYKNPQLSPGRWELAKKSTFCDIERVIGGKNVDS